MTADNPTPNKLPDFVYWMAGWMAILRHPIMRPIDLAKAVHTLLEMEKKHD